MDAILKGAKSVATAKGAGQVLGIFAVLVLLAWFGFTPSSIAANHLPAREA